MDNFEKHISNALQNDKLPFTPDENIHTRLMYRMQLKASAAGVRKNQFLPSLAGLLTTKLLAWKVGLAAIFLISFMGYRHFTPKTGNLQFVDSTRVVQTIDTTNMMVEDTVAIN